MEFTVQQLSKATGEPKPTIYWKIANDIYQCEVRHFGRMSVMVFSERQIIEQFGEDVLTKLSEVDNG